MCIIIINDFATEILYLNNFTHRMLRKSSALTRKNKVEFYVMKCYLLLIFPIYTFENFQLSKYA